MILKEFQDIRRELVQRWGWTEDPVAQRYIRKGRISIHINVGTCPREYQLVLADETREHFYTQVGVFSEFSGRGWRKRMIRSILDEAEKLENALKAGVKS